MDQAASTVASVATIVNEIEVPPLGTHWVEQGGIFLGIVRAPEGDCALILCADERGRFEDRTWGEWNHDVAGAASRIDGRANTKAMAEHGCQLAVDIHALEIAGHADWYLPAQGELQIANANAPDHFDKGDWYWASTQYSPYGAWVQVFEYGGSRIGLKFLEFRAVAVRRFVL